MRNERGSALLLLLAVVAVIAVVEGIFLIQLSGRVSELEEPSGKPAGPESTASLADRVDTLEFLAADTATGLDALAKETELLRTETTEYGTVVRRMDGTLRSAPAGSAIPAAAPEGVSAAAIEKVVAQTVDKRLKEAREKQGGGGEWKPTLQQFKETFDLTEDQTTRAEEVFDNAKHEVFQLASIRGDDGTAMIDSFVTAFQDPDDPEKAMKKVFMSLFTKKIPGREETYIVEVLRIKDRAEHNLKGILKEEQRVKLGRMNIDYLGVHTSYDPFGEYIQEAVK